MNTGIILLLLSLCTAEHLFCAAPALKKIKIESKEDCLDSQQSEIAQKAASLRDVLDDGCNWNKNAWQKKRSTILELVQNGADPEICVEGGYFYGNSFTRCSPLISAACYHSDAQVVKCLTDAHANINKRNHFGVTPIWQISSLAIAYHLLDCGADLTLASNDTHEKPLHALAKKSTDNALLRLIARVSLQQNPRALSEQNNLGNTPLHNLILDMTKKNQSANEQIASKIAILLHEGAPIESRNKEGHTPLDLLSQETRQEVLDWPPEEIEAIADQAVAESEQEKQRVQGWEPLQALLEVHLPNVPLAPLVSCYAGALPLPF